MKLLRQGADTKYKNEEIKRIQRPTEKASDKRIPLYRRQPPKPPNDLHAEVFSAFLDVFSESSAVQAFGFPCVPLWSLW